VADATPLILDVDTGVDDALAIGLAVSRPDVDLLAVSTLAGNIDVVNATENSRRVLGLIGASAIPVHQGASRPLARIHRNAAHYHGKNGLGDAELPKVDAPLGASRGPAAIIHLARQRPGEIVLVATGPLTNVAIALNVFPELPSLLKRFVVMGGSYRNPGNITPHAEFNIWADPEAAQQVFATDFPDAITVGLDVSHQTLLLKSSWEESLGKPHALAQLLSAVCRRSFVDRAQADFPLHDPLAAAVALDPALVATERGVIDVVTDGERDGKTVFTANPAGSWQVALGVNSGRFVSEFLASYQLSAQ
jgi:inosine-uridine nucleoside N-ribohydrolase